MTSESFDPVSGMLRLAPGSLGALVAVHRGKEMSQDDMERLRHLGLVGDGALDPRVARIAMTVQGAWARLSLRSTGETGSLRVEGWVTGDAAVLAVPDGARLSSISHFMLLPRQLVPLQLARLLRLGPRTRPKVVEPVELDAAFLETLLGSSTRLTPEDIEVLTSREALISPWKETLGELVHPSCRRWRVGCWWNSRTQSPEARDMEVLDSGAGNFLLSPLARGAHTFARVRLRPVTSTGIWRLLCSLLPDATEVDRPLSS
jgi:hypothetical protein